MGKSQEVQTVTKYVMSDPPKFAVVTLPHGKIEKVYIVRYTIDRRYTFFAEAKSVDNAKQVAEALNASAKD